MAIVAEGDRGRVYLPPTEETEAVAQQARPDWKPDVLMLMAARSTSASSLTGMDLFSSSSRTASSWPCTTFSDLIQEASERVKRDALVAGLPDDGTVLSAGGNGASAYGDAVGVYLAFAISKLTDYATTLCRWFPERDSVRIDVLLGRRCPCLGIIQKLNPVHDATGSVRNGYTWVAECVQDLV